jgi:hypothetical protein
MRINVEGPRLWPEYSPDYCAVFFNDPDGIRLEVMNYLKRCKLVRKLWNELEGFSESSRSLGAPARQSHLALKMLASDESSPLLT